MLKATAFSLVSLPLNSPLAMQTACQYQLQPLGRPPFLAPAQLSNLSETISQQALNIYSVIHTLQTVLHFSPARTL